MPFFKFRANKNLIKAPRSQFEPFFFGELFFSGRPGRWRPWGINGISRSAKSSAKSSKPILANSARVESNEPTSESEQFRFCCSRKNPVLQCVPFFRDFLGVQKKTNDLWDLTSGRCLHATTPKPGPTHREASWKRYARQIGSFPDSYIHGFLNFHPHITLV